MYGSDIDEIIPPDVSGFSEGMLTALLPTADDLQTALYAGGGVIGGMVVGKAVEKFALDTLRLPRVALPFVHAVVGIGAAKFAGRYSPSLAMGLGGAFGALAIVRALDFFFNVKISAMSGLEDADLADLSDILAGEDDLLPPELMGLDGVSVEDMRAIPEDINGVGQVAVESMAGWSF